VTISALRTLALPSAPALSVVLRWLAAGPSADLDHSLDITRDLADADDVIVGVVVDMAPSGAGEAVLQSVSVSGAVITAWVSGGVPGRAYVVRMLVTTAGGRVFEYLPVLPIDPALASVPVPLAPSTAFGTPQHWQSIALDFSNTAGSAYLALI
jgi:hypothetical protein